MGEPINHIIAATRTQWRRCTLAGMALLACAGVLPPVTILYLYTGWLWIPLFVAWVATFVVLLYVNPSWRVGEEEIVRYLNKEYPTLEESAGLLLRDTGSLNLLEQLQLAKTRAALQQIKPPSFLHSLRRPLLIWLVTLVFCLMGSWMAGRIQRNTTSTTTVSPNSAAGVLPAGVRGIIIGIVPPVYTKSKPQQQENLNLAIAAGSTVTWKLKLYRAAKAVRFVFNDSLTVALRADAEKLEWTTTQQLSNPGFYQVQVDGVVSELYRIEVKPDQPPVITVQSPLPSSIIEYGEPEQVNVRVQVSDDYGVKAISLYATIAKGSGEAVKFTSQQISFGVSFAEQRMQYNLEKRIALRGMGMEPGDELYFYLAAIDNNNQEKRSDIYIVTLADTAKLMSMDGLLNGVNLKPDYFRSQRQIIIETEQLLRDKDTAITEHFNNRSNNLGVDQKLLRLRYGKFLGEEASSNEDVSDHDIGNPADFGNAAVILDAFTDHHDNAEDATFLDAATKKQLKAVLTEMWKAELQLRLFKPREALPFEYKALRLLKDLQQQSRAYVAKTSIKTPPIRLEKRLTGKLDKITEPDTRSTIRVTPDPTEGLREALRVLESLKYERTVDAGSLQTLRLASPQLNARAVKEPGVFLEAFETMKKILKAASSNERISLRDIKVVQSALYKMTTTPARLPSRSSTAPGSALQDAYFKHLPKNSNR